jgi:putative SOS response-associated peptidase YedK
MCNLYSMTRSQEAMRRFFKPTRDIAGNIPLLTGIFPDSMAPIIRIAEQERQIVMMR